MGTEISIELAADDTAAESASLRRWLREDDATRRLPAPTARPPADGEMGGATDVLQLLLEPSGVATAAISALVTWLSTRNRRVKLTVRAGERSVEIDAASPADAERLAREVVRRLELPPE